MTNTVKVAISLQEELLNQVDQVAKDMGKTRSALVRAALQDFIAEREDKETLDKAKEIYNEIAESDQELSEKFLSISAKMREFRVDLNRA